MLNAIEKRGILRVGVFTDRLPFVFLNREGIWSASMSKWPSSCSRLGVRVEFVEIEASAALPPLFAAGASTLP